MCTCISKYSFIPNFTFLIQVCLVYNPFDSCKSETNWSSLNYILIFLFIHCSKHLAINRDIKIQLIWQLSSRHMVKKCSIKSGNLLQVYQVRWLFIFVLAWQLYTRKEIQRLTAYLLYLKTQSNKRYKLSVHESSWTKFWAIVSCTNISCRPKNSVLPMVSI